MEGQKSMKKILITIAALGLTSGMAFAQDIPAFAGADSDTSGDVNLAEAQVVWPDLTQEAFDAADTDKSGSLNQAEYDALAAGGAAATAPAQ
jgi:hypothetical protein